MKLLRIESYFEMTPWSELLWRIISFIFIFICWNDIPKALNSLCSMYKTKQKQTGNNSVSNWPRGTAYLKNKHWPHARRLKITQTNICKEHGCDWRVGRHAIQKKKMRDGNRWPQRGDEWHLWGPKGRARNNRDDRRGCHCLHLIYSNRKHFSHK